MKLNLRHRLRRYFISGLLVWIPIWVTVIVIKFIIDILDQTILLIPPQYQIPGMGVIITIGILLLTGFIAANYFGKRLVLLWDAFVARIPLVRTLHAGVKKIMETIMTPEDKSFRKVLLIQYPLKGMWSIAFQTGTGEEEVNKKVDEKDLISVFVPMTPNITSGFLLILPKKDTIELKMTVDQALKFIISLGVVQPELQDKKK